MEVAGLLLQPESKTLEFKRDLSSLDPILKTIVAFANTAGGTLIIGVTSEGKLIGLQNVFKEEEKLANSIADTIKPSIFPSIEICTVAGKHLIVVKVSYWRAPFHIKKEGFPQGVYIRLGSTTRPISAEFFAEMQRSIHGLSYDREPVAELTQEDIDRKKMNRVFKKELSFENMRSLGLLVPFDQRLVPSNGAIILFGKQEVRDRYFPDIRVRCARFLGNNKAQILDHYEVSGEEEGILFDALHEVPKFIARNTRLTAEFGEMRRKDVAEYPPEAIREALINALAHMDYSMRGSHIQIAIFDDRLEIQNPGSFPYGFTFEDFKTGVSHIRNKVIARVFNELDLMEEWGSGYRRIIETCKEGSWPEPHWKEIATVMRVTFYPYVPSFVLNETPKFNEGESRSWLLCEEPAVALLEREQKILQLFISGKELPFREILKHFKNKVSERTLRYDLLKLKKKGFLISKGKGRSIVWHSLK